MSAPFDLSGKAALVTGGTGRLGRVIGRALADHGARVALVGRDQSRVRAAADEIGANAVGIAADLVAEGSPQKLVAEAGDALGRLDILVNCAGVARDAPLGHVSRADFDAVFGLNVTAAYLCAQAAASIMRQGRGGKIVNIGSIYGSVAPDDRIYESSPDMVRASAPYMASKGALESLTRELAVRLAIDRIQVNLVAPGGVKAEQPATFQRAYSMRIPAARMATADDVAGAVVFLASPASDYVTGQVILVDGGLTAW